MYLTLQQSIKLLTIEYQKGHTFCDERAHFLVFNKVGGHRAPVPPAPQPLNPDMTPKGIFLANTDKWRALI